MTKTILVPLDGTDGAEAGLHWAVRAAQRGGSGLDLLTVVCRHHIALVCLDIDRVATIANLAHCCREGHA